MTVRAHCGLAAGFLVSLALGAQAQTPGNDLRNWSTADLAGKMSYAGTWTAIDGARVQNRALIGPFWSVVKLGAAQREGVALGGWVYNGSFTSTLPDVIPAHAALFAQQDNGMLANASSTLLGNTLTNGAGSVLVADFNGDGMDDLVFPAHNESPFLWKSSVAWMSGPGGTLTRLPINDAVMDHDAKVVTLEGRKAILAASFGGSGNNGNGAGSNPVYTWSGTGFTVATLGGTSLNGGGGLGMSVIAGPFTGNPNETWIVTGSANAVPGIPYSISNRLLTYAFRYANGSIVQPPTTLPQPYFNDKPEYAGFVSQWDPYSKTHTSRLWTTDLNMDGLPDILAGQELWSASGGLAKSVFQVLINRGNMNFEDMTDALAPEYSKDSIVSYSVRFVDLDGSGIETMLHSATPSFSSTTDAAKQGQYILVNDGTGRLYAAMHDEFRAMGIKVNQYLRGQQPLGIGPDITPQFIAYRNAAGEINFLAVQKLFNPNAPDPYAMVSIATRINLTTDFKRDLTIPTRNGSKRIRTFAGNDTIHRVVSDPSAAIDGGLGNNTAVYPGPRANWTIAKSNGVVTIRPTSGTGGTDTLTRIQTARFDDTTVNLDTFVGESAANYSALWWNAAEPGWGLNVAHQDSTVFALLYTYAPDTRDMWLVASDMRQQPNGSFTGTLYRTTGPAFNTQPWGAFTPTAVGTMTLTFTSGAAGTLTYTFNGTTVTKSISRYDFASPVPTCTAGTGSRAALTNYQDLWWNPAEAGWGLNIAHQGNTLFVLLYTYMNDGRDLWLVASGLTRQSNGSYTGTLYRTTGPAFNAQPWGNAPATTVGTMTLSFTSGEAGTLTYTFNGTTVTKAISRYVFGTAVPSCR
ncbi:FG-GAP repeat domain-containing protein [Usitatibacter palustris]|uniref:Repeat domain-containing protein n=1 Tax=Usitatibacter palustris TaxID=2732487 RepID=A0A6M4HAG2_9PROT|nr:VCBS repeat-containing protein [Usitatibacter palustris]QJR16556.1 hypothetical protein DSM104440_03391 [Usitatibacter palustris]